MSCVRQVGSDKKFPLKDDVPHGRNVAAAPAEAAEAGGGSTESAAAALLQWAWVQVADRELEAPPVGALERALLLHPGIVARRLERLRAPAARAVEFLRADALFAGLLQASLERRFAQHASWRAARARAAEREAERAALACSGGVPRKPPRMLVSGADVRAPRRADSLPALHARHASASRPPSSSSAVGAAPRPRDAPPPAQTAPDGRLARPSSSPAGAGCGSSSVTVRSALGMRSLPAAAHAPAEKAELPKAAPRPNSCPGGSRRLGPPALPEGSADGDGGGSAKPTSTAAAAAALQQRMLLARPRSSPARRRPPPLHAEGAEKGTGSRPPSSTGAARR